MDEQPVQADIATLQTALRAAQQRNAQLEELLRQHAIEIPAPLNDDLAPNVAAQHHASIDAETRLHLFEALLKNALDGVAVSNKDGVITFANPAFETLTGFGDRAVGSHISEYYAPEDLEQIVSEIVPMVEEFGSYQGHMRYRRPDGSFFIGQVSGFAIQNGDPQLFDQAVFVRDVTNQVRADEERASLQLEMIDAQQNLLRELSTPLMPIANGVVVMPIVGEIDTGRAHQIMETLLVGISEQQAETAIIDITGVKFVDTQIASTLLQMTRAAQLLGTQVIVSGIGADMAQTFVLLDSDLREVITHRSLQSAIAYALDYV
jgi:rsbT co-antagonist protein RsbR